MRRMDTRRRMRRMKTIQINWFVILLQLFPHYIFKYQK